MKNWLRIISPIEEIGPKIKSRHNEQRKEGSSKKLSSRIRTLMMANSGAVLIFEFSISPAQALIPALSR